MLDLTWSTLPQFGTHTKSALTKSSWETYLPILACWDGWLRLLVWVPPCQRTHSCCNVILYSSQTIKDQLSTETCRTPDNTGSYNYQWTETCLIDCFWSILWNNSLNFWSNGKYMRHGVECFRLITLIQSMSPVIQNPNEHWPSSHWLEKLDCICNRSWSICLLAAGRTDISL